MAKKKKRKRGSAEREAFLWKVSAEHVKDLIARATAWELEFKDILDKSGVEYTFQHPVVYDRQDLFIIDFYLPKYKIAFELDGAHHYEKSKAKADAIRTKKISSMGIFVKRIMNRNVKHVTPVMILNYLKMHSINK